MSTIPRWTPQPVPGFGERETTIPATLVAALRHLADEVSVPLSAVLLTAHAKVLGALSGERAVTTGYASESGSTRPCHLTTEPRSWRDLLRETARAQSRAQHDGNGRPRSTVPAYETVFQAAAGAGGEPAPDTVLRVRFAEQDGLVLRLWFSTEAMDADCAARIADYYLAALTSIAVRPDAEHERQCLLSAHEMRYQIHGLGGPRRALPERRAHEIFEERARARPDAIAAEHGGTTWTYRELNARANRVARALLARGLAREGVVGVVTDRNLDWMAAVLAIHKAGGVYLPIEPDFPPDRIGRTLSRSDCSVVLTEPGRTDTLDRAMDALPRVEKLFIDAACEESRSDADLGVDVPPEQLAYIYFTSGSTGEPKGAMCEHAGMLNHLYAKIDDLGITEADVVAQTAPQCFDISLWQLLSALLVGGRTLLVDQQAIMSAQTFLDTLVERRVTVAQVVPSYLEVLATCLERHPRSLPDLRLLSVTGEALKKELVQRWFAVQPEVRLVNAYGLTETSDDTNHEILDDVPGGDRVPLGRPVNNVHVYVVDEHLSPVPLGAPGEIVFSGVCVGRGYVNDHGRTRGVFLDDPHRPGQRLYRSGDYGRWLPDGKLEFLGRRDTQVKINGFRIEIGELENTLLSVPGVRESAVVTAERADRSKHLVAFYSGERPLDVNALRERLRTALPEYMLPAAYHWRDGLPLTENGKLDRKALTTLARELAVAEQRDRRGGAPGTPTEQWLASAWAEVLGIAEERIARLDHFFHLGGTSLAALKLVIALDRVVAFNDLTSHPILADQAELLEHRGVGTAPVRAAGLRCAT